MHPKSPQLCVFRVPKSYDIGRENIKFKYTSRDKVVKLGVLESIVQNRIEAVGRAVEMCSGLFYAQQTLTSSCI